MKKILITGKNSYVGNNLAKWLGNYPDSYSIDLISLRDNSWTEKDFSKYNVIVHVAGIAHVKETRKNAHLYYKINRDLAYKVAIKAKDEGIIKFIFFSSMSVYGLDTGVINNDTTLNPKNNYGKSKLEAEELITSLEDDVFKVAIIRPPMIYGKGCKGNYQRLSNLVVKIPVFPYIDNMRSMIYIDNLSEFIRFIIDYEVSGVYFPQNKNYVNTTKLVSLIAKAHGKEIKTLKLLNLIITIGIRMSKTLRKVFGSLVYDKNLQGGSCLMKVHGRSYIQVSLEDSIKYTEDSHTY
jgi:nucleoside-diphosphate-sugar epimerase